MSFLNSCLDCFRFPLQVVRHNHKPHGIVAYGRLSNSPEKVEKYSKVMEGLVAPYDPKVILDLPQEVDYLQVKYVVSILLLSIEKIVFEETNSIPGNIWLAHLVVIININIEKKHLLQTWTAFGKSTYLARCYVVHICHTLF